MSERSERVRILTRITVIISISLLLVTAGSASCHDDRSPLISTLFPHPSRRCSARFPCPSHTGGTDDKGGEFLRPIAVRSSVSCL